MMGKDRKDGYCSKPVDVRAVAGRGNYCRRVATMDSDSFEWLVYRRW